MEVVNKDGLKKYWPYFLATTLGGTGGYLYYYFWGCANGCPLKSSAPIMTVYGAMVGLVIYTILYDFIAGRREKRRHREDTPAA